MEGKSRLDSVTHFQYRPSVSIFRIGMSINSSVSISRIGMSINSRNNIYIYIYIIFSSSWFSWYSLTFSTYRPSSWEIFELNWMYLSLIGIILRWGFLNWELIFIYCGLFVLILVVFFMLFLLSLRFGQISSLAFFRWFTATSDRNAESCNRIPCNYCLL